MLDAKPHNHIFVFTLSLLVCASSAVAQNDSPSLPKPTDTPAAVTNRTRARQVTKPAPEKSGATPTTAQPQKPNTETVAAPVNPSEDPFGALRAEIDAATTPEERARLQFKLVNQLVAAGMKQEAIAELHSMVGEDRFDPKAFFNIGNAFVRLGDSDGAIDAYRKAIDQRKGNYSRALNNLGVILLREGRWDEAYEALVSALRLERFRYAEASYNLGRLYAARGETEMAAREWRRALAVDPEHAGASQALGNPRSDGSGSGSRSNVAARAAKQPAAIGSPSLTKNAASKPGAAGPLRSADRSRSLTVDPVTYDLLQRARNERERGRNEDAVRDYRSMLSRMGGYFPPANLELGFVLITLKRSDDAIASLLPVSANDGARYPIVYYHLGRLYELKGDLQTALENYTRAAANYGDDDSPFLLDVSRAREKLGDLSGALTALERYVQANERLGHKPAWSVERVAQLRQKIAASSTPAKP